MKISSTSGLWCCTLLMLPPVLPFGSTPTHSRPTPISISVDPESAGASARAEGAVEVKIDPPLCTNDCLHPKDGKCDDGGLDSDYAACHLGADCADCGQRASFLVHPAPNTNSCEHASDGECDDGGPGSEYSACDSGTDWTDCGQRDPGCVDTCILREPRDGQWHMPKWVGDEACDDGGEGSKYSYCHRGTDCSDCGPRAPPLVSTNVNPQNQQNMLPLGQCEGDCDDDAHCAEGLYCSQRIGTDAVPGCTGTPNNDWDYCVTAAAAYTECENLQPAWENHYENYYNEDNIKELCAHDWDYAHSWGLPLKELCECEKRFDMRETRW